MNKCCFICNNRTKLSLRNATSIFGQHITLQSGKTLSEVVGNIVDKPLEEDKVHSTIICKKCFKTCFDYDLIQVRLQKLKAELLDQFKQSIKACKLDYDNYGKPVHEKSPAIKQPVILGKKLVLPASKLQPVPPGLLLKVGKLPALNNSNLILPKLKPASLSTLNLKVTVGTSVLTQTIKTTTTTKPIDKPQLPTLQIESVKQELENIVTSQSHSTPKTSILNYDVNSLPNNFLSDAVIVKSDEDHEIIDDGDKGNDVHTMDIDEECSLSLPVSSADDGKIVIQVDGTQENSKISSESSTYLHTQDIQILDETNEDHKYILGKLKILNEGDEDIDEDEEGHTIVLDGENGSILRMMSGQKLLYEGGEISLVMEDDDTHNDDNNDDHDVNDYQDSNDETSIELQMASDEETAQAILAAAQEQGGAFIKVESGEMFRVQTVDQRLEDSSPNLVVKEGDSFRCLLCQKTDDNSETVMSEAEAMMRHLKKFHDARVYICQFCSAIMRKRTEYTAHIAEHASKLKSNSTRTTYNCSTCGKTFGSRVLMMEHANIHSGLRPYQCDICFKTFASKYTHQAHLKTHAIRPRPYKCGQCNKSFFTIQNLTQHEKTHSGIKDFICTVCNKAFSTQHNLEVHGVVHSGNKAFVCSVCEKAFARRAELRDHMRTHTGERPFECEMCGARFTQRSNLHSHRRATHLDDKRYHCSYCTKKFKRRRLLEYHIKATHTGERPLKCEVCSATFVYPEHFKKHIRIHSGERPYICEICGKSFNSRDSRNTHRFVHSDKKPYECVSCGAGFMRKQLLYAHMNTSGHLAESIVVNQPRVIKFEENSPLFNTDAIIPTASIEVTGNDNTIIENEKQDLSDKFSTIFEAVDDSPKSSDKIEDLDHIKLMCDIISDDKKLILQDADKTTLNLIQDNADPTLLTIHNLEDRSILEAVAAEQLNGQTEIVANDENGGVVRLIQIKLPDGNNGWVALNRCENITTTM